MKHTSSRDLFGYWDECRGIAQAPDRNDLEPGPVRHLLGDAFVLSYNAAEGHPFRVAGTRVCALLGRDMKGLPFMDLWCRDSLRDIGDLIGIVAEEMLAAVAGTTANNADGSSVHLELLLLPFLRKPHAPLTVAGVLVPLTIPALDAGGLRDLNLNGWRHMGHRPVAKGPRSIKRWMSARGFTVFEGARSD